MMITETVDNNSTTYFYQVRDSVISDVKTYTYSDASQDDIFFVRYVPSPTYSSTERIFQFTTTVTGIYNKLSYKKNYK